MICSPRPHAPTGPLPRGANRYRRPLGAGIQCQTVPSPQPPVHLVNQLHGQFLLHVSPGCPGWTVGAQWASLASLGLGLEIPVTSLACHRRNRDPGDSRSRVCSAGLCQTRSSRPSVCHSLSPAASLANEKSGWRHGGQFLAQGAGRKAEGGSWRAEDQ